MFGTSRSGVHAVIFVAILSCYPPSRSGSAGPASIFAWNLTSGEKELLVDAFPASHTHPPSVVEGQEPVAQTDPGFLGSATLVPTPFASGNFVWKGNKRMTVELPKVDGKEGDSEEGVPTTEEPAGGAEESKPEEPPAGEVKEGDEKTPAKESAA
ncbi:hypothetical protein HYDPIDRAFT_29551 [Hydnomerulius pinastri MD-312]|uniref:Uncharacterized protein n=1 Tax=Hydnomerulius pinastri MD-312 TaxID=994086 RepID=A0A0C9WEF9_9AGAM|nr:hypothetical protein HYDPIDRAFT_29551 [Hydnomerulius pinastri MD-312]